MRMATLTLVACAVLGANAQDRPKVALSLSKAIDIALAPDGSARVQLAKELIETWAARSNAARAALLPNIDASWNFQSFTRNLAAFGVQFSAPIPGFQVPTLAGPIEVSDLRATVSQTILDLSAIRRLQAARAAVEAARADLTAARLVTAEAVANAYWAAQRAAAARDAAQANLRLAGELVRLAESQKNAGTGTGIEIVRAGVQRSNEQQRVFAAEEEVRAARLRLLRVMNLDLAADIELSDELRYQPVEIPAVTQAVESARQKRPELRAQELRGQSARLNYQAARFERLPSVAAFGDYGVTGSVSGNQLPTRVAGVSVRLPLFDGGRRDARRAEAFSASRQEEIRERDLRKQIELEVRLAIDALELADRQVKVALEGLAQAEQELAQARRRVEAGVAPGLEVTDAQTRLARARDNHIAAVYRHRLARVEMAASTGNLDAIAQ